MDSVKQKPITSKTGSRNFMKELQTRKFPDAQSILLDMSGRDVTKEFFQEHGFRTPILVKEPGDLGIKIPPVTDLNVLLKYLVPDLKEVDVIDVEKQDTFKMAVVEYFKYIMSPEKTRILNLISMEVSKTRLSEYIEPPKVVRDIDWVHCYWNRSKDGHKAFVPSATEKYCLISPSNSFTDFHVDFSGTSVWYHIVTGVKDFYLVKPSAVNNHLFWKWSSSYHKEAQFFGDQVDECYKLRIEAGQTLLLPTGWIHAVYTPEDSLVYGGNFLNTYNVEEQFGVFDMELREKVVEKYVYPHFRELNWFAAEGLCREIDDLLQKTDILSVPCHLLSAVKVALPFLKGWSTKLSVQEKSRYNSDQLFKDMNRILRLYERAVAVRNTEKRESTRVKKRPHSDDFILYDDFKINKVKKVIKVEPVEPDRPTENDLGFHSQETEEDLSLEAWKVKTDAKTLSVIIKRCPPSSYSPNRRSDTPTSSSLLRPSILNPRDVRPVVTPEPPKKSSSPTYGESSVYRISRSPIRSKPMYTADVLEPRGSQSSPTIRIKSVRNWSSPEAQTTHEIIPSSPADSVGSPLSSPPPPSEEALGRNVHQDDDYIYPGLDSSDDEEPFMQNSTDSDDKAWAPSGKSLAIIPKSDRPQRMGKTKIAVEKGLEAAAAKPSSKASKPAVFPPRKFIPLPKKVKVRPPKPSSSSAPPAAPPADAPPLKDKNKGVVPIKKGTTAKQRLGKILKLHKMRR